MDLVSGSNVNGLGIKDKMWMTIDHRKSNVNELGMKGKTWICVGKAKIHWVRIKRERVGYEG